MIAMLGGSGIVWPHAGAGLPQFQQLGSQRRDDAAIVGAAADAGRRFEDLQFATNALDGVVQLIAQGFFRF